MKKVYVITVLSLLCALFFSTTAKAHDLWLYASEYYPEAGEKIQVKVIFGHNFPFEDILIPKEQISGFSYVTPSGEKRLITNVWEDRKGERKGSLVAEIALSEGSYIVAAGRIRKGNKSQVPSEKYGKAIVVVNNKNTENLSSPLGHRIEIIPLKNPRDVRAGEDFPVKILFEGKPLSTYVYATYAGYWSESEPFPVITKSDQNGNAYIKITKPGLWMVVCNHKIDFSASLTFEIK